ncbi:hypothetical protein HAX54_010635 [Datura stramonium]|uniref:Uncharacterized protein n=1 Tax=Datura stramonium TaxID=4076 RepID=A0ABS8RXF5_DATST|nr:hypothetical protein [Datura stramonium]
MSREARIWLKIICAYLVPGKHVTHVTRERVCLVFSLMNGRPVNVGQIDEEVVDYRPWYDPKGLDVTKTKEPEDFDDDDDTDEKQARVDSDLEFDDDGDDSEMGEAAYSPTNDED